ncbi:MAG: DNA-directed RNA polymerase subunit alpha [Patescibacteria group bacterium]|jgi:DNA-directed RNA polymerase subunit alpha
MDFTLPETSLVQIKTVEKINNKGVFIVEPLSPGYGVTLGNSLRRVLLSSLEGAAISSVKIEGVTHQFSTISGVKEDVVSIILNLKILRFKLNSDEPVILYLTAKGPKTVTAADFDKNPACEIVNADVILATLGKGAKLDMEITVNRGRGYVPVERRKDEKMPIGTIAVDSIYTPVKKVHYEIESTRVGANTDFDKLTLEITTDGSIDPEETLKLASKILVEHFNLIEQACEITPEIKPTSKKTKAAKKIASKKPAKSKSK